MLLIKKDFALNALVDLVEPQPIVQDILSRAEEYILGQARKTIIQNELVRVLHISGLANYHHNEFAHYLRMNSNDNLIRDCTVEQGEFGDSQIKHCWLKAGSLIIDLTIRQFANCENCAPDFLRRLFHKDCFISNNASSLLYQLYRKNNG